MIEEVNEASRAGDKQTDPRSARHCDSACVWWGTTWPPPYYLISGTTGSASTEGLGICGQSQETADNSLQSKLLLIRQAWN